MIEPESPSRPGTVLETRSPRTGLPLDMERMAGSDEIITASVEDHNRGGAILDVRGLRGFVPLSQLVSLAAGPRTTDGEDTQARLAQLHGKILSVKVLEAHYTFKGA